MARSLNECQNSINKANWNLLLNAFSEEYPVRYSPTLGLIVKCESVFVIMKFVILYLLPVVFITCQGPLNEMSDKTPNGYYKCR